MAKNRIPRRKFITYDRKSDMYVGARPLSAREQAKLNAINQQHIKNKQPNQKAGVVERMFKEQQQTVRKLGNKAAQAKAEAKKAKWQAMPKILGPALAFDALGKGADKVSDNFANPNINVTFGSNSNKDTSKKSGESIDVTGWLE